MRRVKYKYEYIEKGGRIREGIKDNCSQCGKEYIGRKNYIGRDPSRYCSRECASLGHRNRIKLECAWCGESFERKLSGLNGSKTGIYFCSRVCKDKAQRLGGIIEIQPDHYGKGERVYRNKALRHYGAKCEICGYDEFEAVLEVHHIDRNRNNNKIKNLIVLCSNHHAVITRKAGVLKKRKLVIL